MGFQLVVSAHGLEGNDSKVSNEKFGAGLRLGFPTGANLKLYNGGHNWDFTLGAWGNRYAWREFGYTASIFYQRQKATGWLPNLDWYVGLGGIVGYRNWRPNDNFFRGNEGFLLAGAQIGLEYNFQGELPLSIGLDLSPTVEVFPYLLHPNFGSSLAIRYRF